MTNPPPARSSWLIIVGIFALALAGIGLLTLAIFTLTRPAATTLSSATATVAATSIVQIPTTTPAPPTHTPEPTPEPALAPTDTAPPAESPTPEAQVSISLPANVRGGPGLTYPILGGLNPGEQAPLLGRDNSATWYAIRYAAASTGIGWVSNLVSTVDVDVQSLPVVEAGAPPPPGVTPAAPAATNPPPAATNPPAAPTNTAPPAGGSRGLVANYFRIRTATAAVNEKVWFEFEVANPTGGDVPFNILAAHTDVGYTAISWG
ncbi:MAG: SH3 domain-containing protein, partial [Anaerolineales bacterium]|nr:SH3 domain-containing protein [Anaerolineales bacterium]